MPYEYETIKCSLDQGVLTASISNPPCNVMTGALYRDLSQFTADVEHDEAVKVVVLESADPDFFIAHFDVELILRIPADAPPERQSEIGDYHAMCARMRTMPKATIAKIAGRAGGGGNEFASCCDMRFGVRNKTIINQMEVALGILPGGSGTQMLPRLVGRGPAMEIMLGSDDIDATTLEQWGYLNRVFEFGAELDEFVDRLAHRIAGWPADAIRLCKQSINNAELELDQGLIEEAFLFQQTLRTKGAQENMRAALTKGLQTREGELRVGELCLEIPTKEPPHDQ